jgi:hypothetical protein
MTNKLLDTLGLTRDDFRYCPYVLYAAGAYAAYYAYFHLLAYAAGVIGGY